MLVVLLELVDLLLELVDIPLELVDLLLELQSYASYPLVLDMLYDVVIVVMLSYSTSTVARVGFAAFVELLFAAWGVGLRF